MSNKDSKKETSNCHELVSCTKNHIMYLWYNYPFIHFNLKYDFTDLFFRNYSLSQIKKKCITPNLSLVKMRQKHFQDGSYIIQSPGYYILCEDIVFSPNKDGDGKPTKEWLDNIDEQYRASYVLGFFAMIVVQSDNVIIDLNGFKIEQSELFFHQQTFYSHIELGSSPFLTQQGPASFGKKLHNCHNVVIKNGCLGFSSHHGIHSPGHSKNIILQNLQFEKFAVGAIHLNGAHNVYMCDIDIDNKDLRIKFNSLFSQSQFIRPFLDKIEETNTIQLGGTEKTIKEIKDSIDNDIDQVYQSIKDPINFPYPMNGIFYNESELDANMYGIVLNSNGIAVNDFKPLKTSFDIGNNNIVLKNISINNITSKGTEIRILSEKPENDESYGKGGFTGPRGDVFDFHACKDENGFYQGNCLSDAQLAIAKYLPDTRVNIPEPILDWAASESINIYNVIENEEYYIVRGRDSMSHVMKGTIGLFCSQTYRLAMSNITINNIMNTSESDNHRANYCAGLLFSGCIDSLMKKFIICNVFSTNGFSDAISYKNENKNIVTVHN